MTSPLQITDKLLAATGHGTLDEFLDKLIELNVSPNDAVIDFYKATGLLYDFRTIKRWMVMREN